MRTSSLLDSATTQTCAVTQSRRSCVYAPLDDGVLLAHGFEVLRPGDHVRDVVLAVLNDHGALAVTDLHGRVGDTRFMLRNADPGCMMSTCVCCMHWLNQCAKRLLSFQVPSRTHAARKGAHRRQ